MIVRRTARVRSGDLDRPASRRLRQRTTIAPATKPSSKPRKKARRNIGALPSIAALRAGARAGVTTGVPVLRGSVCTGSARSQRSAGRHPGDAAGAAHDPSQIRLPRLTEGRGPGHGAAATDRGRHGLDGAGDPHRRAEFAWHLPLYRQAQILAGQGIHLDRATLAAG